MARDHDVDSLSPRLPPTTLSHEPLELRSPGMLPPPPRSLPLWSALELPMGTMQPRRGNSEGCLKPDRGLFKPSGGFPDYPKCFQFLYQALGYS
ncbi:hypothetical protein KUCAC02_012039 [Chaenocephalus aceratus]|uniref:Uncharacterized protein n=1 Tax=Chaenocephalus aceratus TaxID=36190 RepID=A0ACB9XBH6_CHAAC|nr:hypothetical protein KUCAC02_012039 [Chaenocephalus aceratus]